MSLITLAESSDNAPMVTSADEARHLAFALLAAADDLDIINGVLTIPEPRQPEPHEDGEIFEYLDCDIVDDDGTNVGINVTTGWTTNLSEWNWITVIDERRIETPDEAKQFIIWTARAARIMAQWSPIPREEVERLTGMVKGENK